MLACKGIFTNVDERTQFFHTSMNSPAVQYVPETVSGERQIRANLSTEGKRAFCLTEGVQIVRPVIEAIGAPCFRYILYCRASLELL